jgi:hypothetical protein
MTSRLLGLTLAAFFAPALAINAAGAPRSFLLRLHDAVWVNGTRIACLVETKTGAASNALLRFKHAAASMSLTPEPRSDAIVMAEAGVGVVDTGTGKGVFLWYSRALPRTAPAGYAQANPLLAAVALLHKGGSVFVAGTNVRCQVIEPGRGPERVLLLVCDLGNSGGVPAGSYVAGIGDGGIQVLGPAGPDEKELFFRRLP